MNALKDEMRGYLVKHPILGSVILFWLGGYADREGYALALLRALFT